MTQITCCICQDYRRSGNMNIWYTPSIQERRSLHFEGKKLSHGYCPTCYILKLRESGMTSEQLERIVTEVGDIK